MMGFDALIFLYNRHNRYSVHALLASLPSSAPVLLLPLEQISSASREFDNPLIAVSFTTPYLVEHYDSLLRLLEQSRGVKVAGGPHPTGDPLGTLLMGFDYVFVGDGEASLPAFLEGDLPPGLVFREGDEFFFTGWNRVDLNDYWSFPWWMGLFSPIEIERGCLHACRYCETPFIHGRSRYRGIESVVEHVERMKEGGKRHVRFIASDSLSYPYFFDLLEIEGVRLYVGSFPSEVRPDSVTEEKVEAMRGRVSNKRVIVGAQSGSDRMLELMNRGHTVEDVKYAVEVLLEGGFVPEVDFIFGLPGEGEEDVRATIELMSWIVERGGRVHAHAFMPLPGTAWEGSAPGAIPDSVKRFLERQTGRGRVYGQWKRQERIGALIHMFYREGKILGFRGWQRLRWA